MNSVVASLGAFVAIFCGALAGVGLARRLPEPHLSNETRTAVSVSMAVVGTLAALVIGLMISSASSSFNARTDAIESLAVDIIRLNRALVRYGPEADAIRESLWIYTHAKTQDLSDQNPGNTLGLSTLSMFEAVSDQVLRLQPAEERERQLQSQALKLLDAIVDARWLFVEKSSISMPAPLLVLLIFWLALLFGSFGLFAPQNATVIVVLLLCAMAISGGILMILELGRPTQGLIQPSAAPMLTAINEISPLR